ncbi:phosphotransferase family protein [soil metagenome]
MVMETDTGGIDAGGLATGGIEGIDVEGIDVDGVTAWFADHVDGVTPPLEFSLIAGGHSNLTFAVSDAASDTTGRRWVLRRPPLGQGLATAHEMGREHRIISALGPTDVPVPPAVVLCTDKTVNGAPFYVMDLVDGLVLRDLSATTALNLEQRRAAGDSLVDVLARIHAVDPDAVGLGDLGRKEGYIERQLKRWYGQWENCKTRDLPAVDEVHDILLAAVPEQGPAAIVHGDYRLDNCLVDGTGQVVAVLDWEICTLGDPLADVGLLSVYWTERGDPHPALLNAPTLAEGFPGRAALLDRYAELSGRDLSAIDFYVAFGYWKLACILEGVYARYVGGAMGTGSTGFEGFAEQVRLLAEAARTNAEKIG